MPKKVLIAGAGTAGQMVLDEIENCFQQNRQVVGFVDDNTDLKSIGGVEVRGTTSNIKQLWQQLDFDELIIAIPSAGGKTIRKIIEQTAGIDCRIRIVPGIKEIIEGTVRLHQIREVKPEDLLGRDTVKINFQEMQEFFTGKRVLVTGGAGSIGSQLVEYLFDLPVNKLLALDIDESRLYELEKSLEADSDRSACFESVIADIRDKQRLEDIFQQFKPDIVFHVAALKQVPLLETNSQEAVKTNLGGTVNLINLLDSFSVDDCVFISTDKAVEPKSIMGQTKRIIERLVSTYQTEIKNVRLTAVRFGNVIGSRGSVVPLFKKQIEQGGPITVTAPDVYRYFMTGSEAVNLVLKAASFKEDGIVYLLSMGEPIKIVDLARQLIMVSGYIPDQDISVTITGLRKGEKKQEMICSPAEQPGPTAHPKISWIRPPEYSNDELVKLLEFIDNPHGSDEKNYRVMEQFV